MTLHPNARFWLVLTAFKHGEPPHATMLQLHPGASKFVTVTSGGKDALFTTLNPDSLTKS